MEMRYLFLNVSLSTRINGWKMNEDRTGLAGCVSLSRSMVFSRRFEGVSELPGNLLYGQEDPPDPLGVGAYKDVLDVFWMNAFWKAKAFILKPMKAASWLG
ncbi:hypothetical protein F2Q70_00021204 [Brassica cretica]|uniref:Uncharacterized protein n=1 Tax=Brassica cretica TaxID=69181 RepID=A0A8S9GYJ8_BRACR|nr:hypothetical protein F2Q70_00021204 [Brassica cretica]